MPESFTIIRSNPRWGHTTGCYTTQNVSVRGSDEAYYAWKANPYITKDDKKELLRRKSVAISKLNDLKDIANKAQGHWEKFGLKIQEIDIECQKKCLADLDGDGTCPRAANCVLEETRPYMHMRSTGQQLLNELGAKRLDAFRECDFLMVNAPDAVTAKQMCHQKLKAFEHIREVSDVISKYNRLISDARSRARKAKDAFLGSVQNLLQGFIDAIIALMGIIKEGFKILIASLEPILKLTSAASSFFIEHPNAILVVGGVVGLGVLAFVARPYIGILSAVIGR